MGSPVSNSKNRTEVTAHGTRVSYLHQWIKNRLHRLAGHGIAGGIMSMLFALPALAQADHVDLEEYQFAEAISGVRSARLLDNGDVLLKLNDGRSVVVSAQNVKVLDNGSIMITEESALDVAQLSLAAEGGAAAGGGMGAGGALLGGIGLAGAAAGSGGGGGDDDDSGTSKPVKIPVVNLDDARTSGIDSTITGSQAPAGAAAVEVTIGSLTKSVTPAADNTWSVSLTQAEIDALPQGRTDVTIRYMDSDGLEIASNTAEISIDTLPPSVAITDFTAGAVMNAAEQETELTITGTTSAENGQIVTVVLNGQSYSGTASDGEWSVTIPAGDLGALPDASTVTATADVSDAAGNPAVQASNSFETDFTAPTIDVTALSHGVVLNAAEQAADLIISGSSDAADGAQVTLSITRSDGTEDISGTTTVTGGSWAFTASAADLGPLQDAETYQVHATVADTAGNSAAATNSFTTDFDAPTITMNALPAGPVLDVVERDMDLVVSGSTNAEDGQSVTVTLDGQNYFGVASAGSWSVTVPAADLAALPDGNSFTIAATINDAAGNPSIAATTSVTTDFRPLLGMDAVGSNNAFSLADAQASGLTISGTSAGLGTGQAVDVTLNGASVGSTVVASDGSWSLDVPASHFSAIEPTDDIVFSAMATVAGGADPLPVSENALAHAPAAYIIAEAGRSGSTVTFEMFADADRDTSGGLAVTTEFTFDPSVVTLDTGSITANSDFDLFLANPVGNSVVNFTGAATSFDDVTQSLVTFSMTIQDPTQPIVLTITSPDGGPSTIQFGTDGADSLTATAADNFIRAGAGDDNVDVSATGRDVVVFEADPSLNGTDTITGFTLGPASEVSDALMFSGLDFATLRGAGTDVETLMSGESIGADTGVVGLATTLSDLEIGTIENAAESLTGIASGDVIFVLATDGSDSVLAKVSFADADTASAQTIASFAGLGDLGSLSADNILHTDPTGASA